MEYPYTIKSLATKVGKTEQSLQKFIKKNSQFVNQHTFQSGRFKRYDQAVMDLVTEYYRLPEEVAAASEPEEPATPGEPEVQQDDSAERISELELELQQKNQEIEELKKQLSAAEDERKEMVRQNASLLLLLQEEKQEKMLLLPAPKKSFMEKLRGIFSGSSSETHKNSPNKE